MSRSRPVSPRRVALLAAGAIALQSLGAAAASAQMFESYGFAPRDRASIAFGMRNVEEGGGTGGAVGGGAAQPSQTVLVCGSGEEGSAAGSTANSSCLILNNVTGSVEVGQDSLGNQNATNTQTGNTTTNNTMSDALEGLADQ
jgi:hypothetical protein